MQCAYSPDLCLDEHLWDKLECLLQTNVILLHMILGWDVQMIIYGGLVLDGRCNVYL